MINNCPILLKSYRGIIATYIHKNVVYASNMKMILLNSIFISLISAKKFTKVFSHSLHKYKLYC